MQDTLSSCAALGLPAECVVRVKVSCIQENYGVRGTTLKLIESYLSNRNQYVTFLGELSHQQPVIFGVP